MKSKTKDATNYMGERTFQTYEAWKRACKQIDPNVKFDGDKDICQAKPGIGEWDGERGIIYNTKDRKTKDEAIRPEIKKKLEYIFYNTPYSKNYQDWYGRFMPKAKSTGATAEEIQEFLSDGSLNLDSVKDAEFPGKDQYKIKIYQSGGGYNWEVFDPEGRKSASGLQSASIENAKRDADRKLGMQIFSTLDSKKLMKDAASVALKKLGQVRKQVEDSKTGDDGLWIDNYKEYKIVVREYGKDVFEFTIQKNGRDVYKGVQETLLGARTTARRLIDQNKVKDAKIKDHGYIVKYIGKYKIIEGAGVDGGWWYAIEVKGKPPLERKKFKTREQAEEHAYQSQPNLDSKTKDADWQMKFIASGYGTLTDWTDNKNNITKEFNRVKSLSKEQIGKEIGLNDDLIDRISEIILVDDKGSTVQSYRVRDSKPTAKDKLLKGLDSLKRRVKDAFGMNIEEKQKEFDVRNIEKETIENNAFRKVIFTGNTLQLVLMSLLPNEDIGMEVHDKVDQFFRVEEGEGLLEVKDQGTYPLKAGSSMLIKAGTSHNVINNGKDPLKLYTLYGPPNHPADRLQNTKAEAVKEEEKNKVFGGDKKTKDINYKSKLMELKGRLLEQKKGGASTIEIRNTLEEIKEVESIIRNNPSFDSKKTKDKISVYKYKGFTYEYDNENSNKVSFIKTPSGKVIKEYAPNAMPTITGVNGKIDAYIKQVVHDKKTKDASPADKIKDLLQNGYSLKDAILKTEKSIGRQLNAFEAAEAVAVSKKMGKTKDVQETAESLFRQFKNNHLLDDRREYDVEDFVRK